MNYDDSKNTKCKAGELLDAIKTGGAARRRTVVVATPAQAADVFAPESFDEMIRTCFVTAEERGGKALLEIQMSTEIIGELLEEHNKKNRNLSRRDVEVLEEQMRDDDFTDSRIILGIFSGGKQVALGDGQHRCYAAKNSGCDVVFEVRVYTDKDLFDKAVRVVDTGRARRWADHAKIAELPGCEANPSRVESIVNAMMRFDGTLSVGKKASMQQRDRYFDLYGDAIRFATKYTRYPAHIAAALAFAHKKNPKKALAFAQAAYNSVGYRENSGEQAMVKRIVELTSPRGQSARNLATSIVLAFIKASFDNKDCPQRVRAKTAATAFSFFVGGR